MPIYEFYCDSCNVLFNFFSAKIDTESRPACPRCKKRELERRPARFAMISGSGRSGDEGEDDTDDPFSGIDESRLEAALDSMGGELERLEENEDPRQMARFFRRFGEAAGFELGPRMEEMMKRLEAGEDPDSLDEEMGDDPGDDENLEEWIRLKKTVAGARRRRRPQVDDTMYFL